jgi:hypothetical protein
MDKRLAGLLGAAAALTTVASAQSAPASSTEPTPATSYRDLLEPIPNAVPKLNADNARLAEEPVTKVAQISVGVGVGHHHHHRGVHIRVGRHHHHHHHHHHHRD